MWVAREEGIPVGVVDVESYDDGTAELAMIVAPEHRRAGVCRRMLEAVIDHPALAEVQVLRLGVESENVGAARCAEGAGFVLEPHGPGESGMAHFVRAIAAKSA
jgi:RimJ/RimL family protein N-acetyltransferase